LHFAYSAILSTTSSGLGHGLLMLLGIMGATGLIAADRGFGAAALGLALSAATLALFADILHLGHPERALAAASPGRSAWRWRERLAGTAAYVPAGIFALGWLAWEDAGGPFALAGLATAALACVTVCCTGMIYASLPTVPAWSNRWTVPAYLTLALATGSLWLAALSRLFDIAHPAITHLPVALVLLAWIVKTAYWRRLDIQHLAASPKTAAGPGGDGVPGPSPRRSRARRRSVMRGKGYSFARGHARRLRRTAQGLAFAVPLAFTELEMFLPDAPTGLHTVIAAVTACLGTAGVAVERWLFFAEARRVVSAHDATHDAAGAG
jgi:DMSO reductase anchor subunit